MCRCRHVQNYGYCPWKFTHVMIIMIFHHNLIAIHLNLTGKKIVFCLFNRTIPHAIQNAIILYMQRFISLAGIVCREPIENNVCTRVTQLFQCPREMTLEWAQKQFVMRVHTLLYFLHVITTINDDKKGLRKTRARTMSAILSMLCIKSSGNLSISLARFNQIHLSWEIT